MTHYVWARVAENVWLDPILAAAITCIAHPQAVDAIAPMRPTVLQSAAR